MCARRGMVRLENWTNARGEKGAPTGHVAPTYAQRPIAANMKVQQFIRQGPFMRAKRISGYDIAPGYEFITPATGSHHAAPALLHSSCYATPAEHPVLPNQRCARSLPVRLRSWQQISQKAYAGEKRKSLIDGDARKALWIE